jgi:hypothetical protein
LRALRQLRHDGVQLRRAAGVDLLGAVHAQHQLVGIPVGETVHGERDRERDDHAALAADEITHGEEQTRHRGQQQGGAGVVHSETSILNDISPLGWGWRDGDQDWRKARRTPIFILCCTQRKKPRN